MKKIDEMIKQLCPNGVEYKQLGDICNIKGRIGFRGYTRKDQVNEGEGALSLSPGNIVDGQMDYTKGTYITWAKYDESPEIMTYNGDIIFCKTASVGKVALVKNLPCKATINPQLVVLKEIKCNASFLAYILETDKVQNKVISMAGVGSVPNISQKALSEIEIPLPPLSIQEEIVSILDKFSELIEKTDEEIALRQKQYEYYREKLLLDKSYKKCRIIDLLCQPITDGPHTTPQFFGNGIPFVSADSIWDGRIHFENKRGYISESFDKECSKKYKPQRHDVLMVKSGSTTGKVAYVDTDDNFNIWSPLAAMRVNENTSSRYLFHLLQTSVVQKQVLTKSSQGSQPNLGMRVLEQFDVAVPPLSKQIEIASILDKFDTLVNDLSHGLPAEIEARKQQYEYYREKLLTF